MAFGHWMEVVEGDVRLRLGPIKRDDAKLFISAEARYGLQSYEVARYLGLSSPPTEEGEAEWWDTTSKDEHKVVWGIYVPPPDDIGDWRLIGSTALYLSRWRREAESGFALHDRAYWGKRIASTAHLARTRYAFGELDLLAITSHAFVPNFGSNKALQGVGYVKTGLQYRAAILEGKVVDANAYLCPNPEEDAWRYFWRRPDDEIPDEFHEGRKRTRKALDRAAVAVSYL